MVTKRILVGVALVTAVTACSDGGTPMIPTVAGPSFDGGHTLGGGARAGESTTTQTDTTQRGGHTLGGGA